MTNPINSNASPSSLPVIIIGGGQAGLSTSYYLQEKGIDHLIIEKHTLMNAWKDKRWDSFTLVTPNWQCELPGHPYDGDDPHGFMKREEIIAYLNRFADKVKAPALENTTVNKVTLLHDGSYLIESTAGEFKAGQVVIASGGYNLPIIPRMAEKVPATVHQMHSEAYKCSEQLPPGNVLVVGSGQSGTQIAEDLHLSGRKVFLATGNGPRCARFYRGRDVVDWLADMNYYEMPVDDHPLGEGVRQNTNHYLTGRDGGRDIDLRKFALEGMELFGQLEDFDNGELCFRANLAENLDYADEVYNSINARIDRYIESEGIEAPQASVYSPLWQPSAERPRLNLADSGITTILWCIGFRPDYHWLDAPVFNGAGHPKHKRGVTPQQGLYFVGLPWLHTWGSGRFSGVAQDAEFIVEEIAGLDRKTRREAKEQATA